MSSVVQVTGGKRVYWGGGFEKAEVEAFMDDEEAAEEAGAQGSGGTSGGWGSGGSGLPYSPWYAASDPSDSSVVQVQGDTEVYPGGGFAKAEVDALIEEKEAAGEAIISTEPGCLSDVDCHPDCICIFSPGEEEGTCIPRGDVGVRISGILDDKTCNYCRTMIGRTGTLDSLPIPPFHKYCRCSFVYLV